MTIRHGWMLASLTAALAIVGCGSTITGHPAAHIVISDTATSTTPPASPAGPVALPVSVDIPSIGVHATHLQALGLNPDGTIETPSVKTPQVLGYYKIGGPPCKPGPSKIPFALLGHVDGSGQRGALYRLKDLKSDATVTVGLDNGKSCTYRISELAQFEKQDFPTARVWGPTPNGEIRIISCGGKWIGPPYGYQDNLVGIGALVN